jgi:hypothetical protein
MVVDHVIARVEPATVVTAGPPLFGLVIGRRSDCTHGRSGRRGRMVWKIAAQAHLGVGLARQPTRLESVSSNDCHR